MISTLPPSIALIWHVSMRNARWKRRSRAQPRYMKIEGQFAFGGIAPLAVWSFLTDPDRIAQCLPGCEKLAKAGEDTYDMEMRFGVGAISGIFRGSIRLHDLKPTSEYQMSVDG